MTQTFSSSLYSFFAFLFTGKRQKERPIPGLPKEVQEGAWIPHSPEYYQHRIEDAQVVGKNGKKYHRKMDNPRQIYTSEMVFHPAASGWKCLKCGSNLKEVPISHNHLMFNGGMMTRLEHAPYCPICEDVPKNKITN
jgi:hypothetical protein